MNLLWLDINSSYAHASFALPALHAQCKEHKWNWQVVSGNLNTPYTHFVHDAYKVQPTLIASTAWLFNHQFLLEVVSRIKALLPHAYVILGGPEFLGDNEAYLRSHTYIDAVFRGEGEEVFPRWLDLWTEPELRDRLSGICTLDSQGAYHDNGTAKVARFDMLAAPETSRFFPFRKPFVQLETARGCFNHCAFCVSGGDAPVRYLSVTQIAQRIEYLAENGVREIRLLDRTFNANPGRTEELLALFQTFTGRLRFHLEIHPALLTNKLTEYLSACPKELLHIEAGIQSLDDCVLEASGRNGNSEMALNGMRFLCRCPNFQTHADIIAGLPGYTLARIKEDIRTLMELRPDEIQLELLKLLPGTIMRKEAASLGIVYAPLPPYEVLATPAMDPEELYEARQLSRVLDGWYNGQSDWREPFMQITLHHPYFLDHFLHELMQKQLLEQPLSMERRGLLLYEFCHRHYPDYLSGISIAWISAGHSLKKPPGQAAVPYKTDLKTNPELKYYYLATPTGDYWFGFDRKEERRRPCIILRHAPDDISD